MRKIAAFVAGALILSACGSGEGPVGDPFEAAWSMEVVAEPLGNATGRPGEMFAGHPSGKVAHQRDGEVCLGWFGSEQTSSCIALDSRVAHPSWSPDGRYLVFTEDWQVAFAEPDVWLWDTGEGTLLDLTDDGVEGPAGSDDADFDVYPVFTSETEIAFLRLTRQAQGGPTASLWVVSLEGSASEISPGLVALADFERRERPRLSSAPVGADGRWHLVVSGGAAPSLLTVEVPGGDVEERALDGLAGREVVIGPGPGGALVGHDIACETGGSGCRLLAVDPEDGVAVDLPDLTDDRFETAPLGSGMPAWAPDGSAVAGCFTGITDEGPTWMVALSPVSEPGWRVIAEWNRDDDIVGCGVLVWTGDGIGSTVPAGEGHVWMHTGP